ncbi:tyrosine-type recombinase/integrase [Planobispora siamensis]|uniref:Tyr recombinase domain-containing protein n=1 Tax=Planobispora siamensis TaxID=936338 RepID=A0A8J3SYM1_9ACTN|nr:tyrosine-type recombinase/integrase [Planobispora siamensis]GIH97873.1 hypothetical protein Psi01_85030 [Planobispora siamensis]
MRVSQLTLDSTYRPKAEWWIIPRLGAHRLDRLRPEHLDAFYAGLVKETLAPNTIVQIHRISSRALKLAVRRELIGRNVCQMIDAPIGEDKEIEPLLREEAQAILDVVKERRNGTRWSMALALVKPKGKGRRSIALPPPPVKLLKLHRETQDAEREAAGDKWQSWDLAWCMPDGTPIDAGDDWDEWKAILDLADIDKDARVHDARHTAATLLLEQGWTSGWCRRCSAIRS